MKDPSKSASRKRNMWVVAVISCAATVVGAFATVWGIWISPDTDPEDLQGGRTSSPVSSGPVSSNPVSSVRETTAPPLATGSATATGRSLSSLEELPGSVRRTDSGDLLLGCPTGRAGDREREATFDLPARYTAFTATARAAGQVDPETRYQVEVLAGFREDLAERQESRGILVRRQDEEGPIRADLTGATRLTLRWRCEDRDLRITLLEPTLGG
ncbi:MAG: hypothetical protein QG608_249 [Actinomycetota bacterium]|nr:hypothetical protein [Actinomycetota bacterium]